MPDNLQDLIILGAGKFAREAMEVALAAGPYQVAGLVEGIDPNKAGEHINNIPILWKARLAELEIRPQCIAAIASPRRRALIQEVKSYGYQFASIVAPSAELSPSASIGEGCFLSRGVIVGANARIAEQVFINRSVLIGHDCQIAPYATLSQGAMLGGNVIIQEGAFIGMGAIILENIVIGRHSVVGAGAVVTRSVPEGVQVLGVPATITKTLARW